MMVVAMCRFNCLNTSGWSVRNEREKQTAFRGRQFCKVGIGHSSYHLCLCGTIGQDGAGK